MQTRFAKLGLPIVVLALGAWARLAPWEQVMGGAHPQVIGDTDPHYHVLRAERWIAGAEGAPWRDPALDWPNGADIPWPPLFDAMIAGSARVIGGARGERDTLVAVAAILPVLIGLVFVVLSAALGRRLLGSGAGWISALVVAFTAAGVDPSRIGRPDQHVLETALFCALMLTFLPGEDDRSTRRLPALALALVATLAFWGWMGSALHLLVLVATVAALHLLPSASREDRSVHTSTATLAAGGLVGAVMLAASVALCGRPGALTSSSTTGVGGLQVALTAAAGAFAALLLLVRRARPSAGAASRLTEVAIAAAIPGLALLAFPPLRAGIAGGLTALVAGNPWYANISEFQPLLARGGEPALTKLAMVTRGYGLTFFVAPLALAPFLHAWRQRTRPRAHLVLLAVLFCTFVPAALLRKRFGVYAIVPLALATELALRHWTPLVLRRLQPGAGALRAITAALAALVVLPSYFEHGLPDPTLPRDKIELLRWISNQPVTAGSAGVVAPWALGHAIQYFAARPVLSSPFGTEGGVDAMPAAAEIWFSTHGERAEELLARRRCGLFLLGNVPSETWTLHGFAPAGTPSPFSSVPTHAADADVGETIAYWSLVPVRLYHEDGKASGGLPALDGFRLLVETPATSPQNPALEEQWKLFEPVAGAKLLVTTRPGTKVRASVEVQANTGRRFEWVTEGTAGPEGVASLRLPYASGDNGLARAGPWTITVGEQSAPLVVHEAAVRKGLRIEVTPPPLRRQAGRTPSSSSIRRAIRATSSSKSAR